MNVELTDYGYKIWTKVSSKTEADKEYTITAFIQQPTVYDSDASGTTNISYKCSCASFSYHPGTCKHIKEHISHFTKESE